MIAMSEEATIIEKIKSKSISKCEKEWDIAITESAVSDERKRFFNAIAPNAQVPGFRKGKVPIPILEKHYDGEARSEVVQQLLSRSVREAMQREKEDMIHYPTVRDIQFNGKQLSFKVYIELRPKIKLARYQGLKIKRGSVALAEEEITQIIDRMRERSATFSVVTDRAAQMGDFVVADYELLIDGNSTEKKVDEIFELKNEPLLPGFSEQVVGMQLAETRAIEVVLPESFPRKEWATKKAVFQFTLKDIKCKQLPVADDHWAVSISNFKTMQEVREQISKDLTSMKARDVENAFERSILDELVKQTKFEVAEGTVDRRFRYLVEQNIEHLTAHGHAKEKAEAQTKEKSEEIKKEAERQVRVALIFDEIARAENIAVTDENLKTRIDQMVSDSRHPDEIRKTYTDEDHLQSLRDQMRFEKVLEFLKSSITEN